MKRLSCGFWICALAASTSGADFNVAIESTTKLIWNTVFSNAITTVERASSVAGPWIPVQNFYETHTNHYATLAPAAGTQFYRLLQVEVSATPRGYTNLTQSYGLITTIAGTGVGGMDGTNYWRASMEGGFATNAALSRPHYALADNAGNILVVDKDSHSVLKITPDGRIHTLAGTHTPGNGADANSVATSVALDFPNGIWVRGDRTVYVLDTGNNKIRRVDTNGMMMTLCTVPPSLKIGRGLWVKEDETEAFFCASTILEAWSSNGFSSVNSTFKDLGNIFVARGGRVIVTDRGDNRVFAVETQGTNVGKKILLYGSGKKTPAVDGTLALTNGFYGVRGVWPVPSGGYLLALHEGNQLLYTDTAHIVHIFVDGQNGAHSGDGEWFHSPGFKLGQLRSVSLDAEGNILIVESDLGFVRRINFQRLTP